MVLFSNLKNSLLFFRYFNYIYFPLPFPFVKLFLFSPYQGIENQNVLVQTNLSDTLFGSPCNVTHDRTLWLICTLLCTHRRESLCVRVLCAYRSKNDTNASTMCLSLCRNKQRIYLVCVFLSCVVSYFVISVITSLICIWNHTSMNKLFK